MGTLHYGGAEEDIYIEDRALAHLKVVVTTKLRRDESFMVSWKNPEGQPRGRTAIWVHPSIPLRFSFDGPEAPKINPEWISMLANSASSSGGIVLVPEHHNPQLTIPD